MRMEIKSLFYSDLIEIRTLIQTRFRSSDTLILLIKSSIIFPTHFQRNFDAKTCFENELFSDIKALLTSWLESARNLASSKNLRVFERVGETRDYFIAS